MTDESKTFLLASLLLACTVITATATQGTQSAQQKPPTEQTASGDSAFMRQAAMANMAEVEHGRLAAGNASSSDVKQFAQRMVEDHGKTLDELKGLAAKKKETLPTTLDEKHKAIQDKLAKLKDANFDKEYMTHMVSAHEQALKLFQQEAKNGKDADVKAWADGKTPTIQEHLKLARETSAKVGKAATK